MKNDPALILVSVPTGCTWDAFYAKSGIHLQTFMEDVYICQDQSCKVCYTMNSDVKTMGMMHKNDLIKVSIYPTATNQITSSL